MDKIKFPRTYHFPWSHGLINDDRCLESLDGFIGKEVVVTLKMDGENCTMSREYIHARALEYSPHPSRNIARAIHAEICSSIPEGWRIVGENLFAKHSIHYQNLTSYFQLFAIFDEKNNCLSWDDIVSFAEILNLQIVPQLWRGLYDEETIKGLYQKEYNGDEMEGYVVRIVDKFSYSDYNKCVGKFVRKNHVQTSEHWLNQKLIPNKLKET